MASNSPWFASESAGHRVFLRIVPIAVIALGLIALDVYGIYLREARQHVFVQVFNLDDEATFLVNGAPVLHAGHGDEQTRDLGWLANSDRIETRFVNRGGTYTWGARVSDADGELDLDMAGVIDAIGADGNTSRETRAVEIVHCRRLLADGTGGRITCGTDGGEAKPLRAPPVPEAKSLRDRLVAATPLLTPFLLFTAVLGVVWVVGRRFGLPYQRVIERGLAILAVASAIVAGTNALFGV